MVKNITIFTTNTCGYCSMVKKYLGAKGMNYEGSKPRRAPTATG
jgi:glutaredoxin